jgi:hypothetical protein
LEAADRQATVFISCSESVAPDASDASTAQPPSKKKKTELGRRPESSAQNGDHGQPSSGVLDRPSAAPGDADSWQHPADLLSLCRRMRSVAGTVRKSVGDARRSGVLTPALRRARRLQKQRQPDLDRNEDVLLLDNSAQQVCVLLVRKSS